ncbi:hypothetical protein [Burkholderia gladioli]|uniref:hypothetical protein n=1 Tax=Burkholderia gladioli TaxID=28095 RepID=UPI00163EF822|nr:hypothetical protein [Burkholderia gladioli]
MKKFTVKARGREFSCEFHSDPLGYSVAVYEVTSAGRQAALLRVPIQYAFTPSDFIKMRALFRRGLLIDVVSQLASGSVDVVPENAPVDKWRTAKSGSKCRYSMRESTQERADDLAEFDEDLKLVRTEFS